MNKAVLRLVAHNHISGLCSRLPPSGKPLIHDVQAQLDVLIDISPAEQEDVVSPVITRESVVADIEWLYTSLSKTRGDERSLVSHLLRLDALSHVGDILKGIVEPQSTLGNPEKENK